MKFDPKYQPELIASDDDTRPNLHYVELDVDGMRMLATDGHRGIIVPCEPEPGDVTGIIVSEALKGARKAAKTKLAKTMGLQPSIKANGSLVIDASPEGTVPNMTFARPDRDGQPFPPLDKVMPKFSQGMLDTHTFAVNARYLYELAVALGSAEHVIITCKVGGKFDPILVKPGETGNTAIGVVMPMAL